MSELIRWCLPSAIGLVGVLVGYWIQEQIDRARLRRVMREMFPPIVNTKPPTTAELRSPEWGEWTQHTR